MPFLSVPTYKIIHPCATIREGVLKAIELAGKDGVVLCFGSLYSIGAIHDGLKEVLA